MREVRLPRTSQAHCSLVLADGAGHLPGLVLHQLHGGHLVDELGAGLQGLGLEHVLDEVGHGVLFEDGAAGHEVVAGDLRMHRGIRAHGDHAVGAVGLGHVEEPVHAALGLAEPDSIGGVYSYSSQNHKSTQLIKRTYNLPCNFNWELMGYDNEITFMAPPFDNIVYSYDKKGALRQQIPFKIYPLPTQSYTEDVSTQHLPDFIRTNYIESSHWLYATYWRAESGLRVFLYNKQNGDLQIGKRLVNDIDRVKYTYMTSSCNHNRFVFGYRKEENTDDNPILQILHLKN